MVGNLGEMCFKCVFYSKTHTLICNMKAPVQQIDVHTMLYQHCYSSHFSYFHTLNYTGEGNA